MKRRACALACSFVLAGLAAPVAACTDAVSYVGGCCGMILHASSHHAASKSPGSSTVFTGPLTYASSNVSFMSQLPLSQMGGGKGSSLYAWVDPLTKREYAIFGRSNGTAFIDVTHPTNPKYVANLPMAAGSLATDWREPKVYGNQVFIGVDGTNHPIQVMDLTKLRSYTGTTLQLTADRNFRGNGNTLTKAHTLAINHDTGFLYAARTDKYSGGIMAIDVRNHLNPVEVGGFSGDGITHETQVVVYRGPDIQHRGKEIAFNSNAKTGAVQDTFSIVDVTNKSAITRLSSAFYPNARYIHQGWLTEDHRFFFQNDESDETGGATGGKTRTHLWDVADLDAPIYKGYWDNITTSIDHNHYVHRGYLFQSNYTTGLRILKIGNLLSDDPDDWLEEVGFFDTYPQNDNRTFNGAWNNYPFLPSGNVLVSDIDGGLFVLRPNLPGWDEMIKDVPRDRFGNILFTAVPEPAAIGALFAAMPLLMRRARRRAHAGAV